MPRSRSLSQAVLSIAISMLVWCQTCTIAHAYSSRAPASAANTLTKEPCNHGAAEQNGDSGRDSCQSRCQFRDASIENAKIKLPAVDELPFMVIGSTLLPLLSARIAPNHQIPERAAPPPLIQVYCRLLI